MPRKKSVAPDPNEQEVMDQTMDAVEGAVAEEPAGNDAAPSEETLAQMEREYLASSVDRSVPPEAGSDASIEDNASDGGDAPLTGEGMSGSGEQPNEEQTVSEPWSSLRGHRQSWSRMGLPLKMNRKTLCLLMTTPEGKDLLKAVRRAERLRHPMTMPPF